MFKKNRLVVKHLKFLLYRSYIAVWVDSAKNHLTLQSKQMKLAKQFRHKQKIVCSIHQNESTKVP